ncbi:MAG: DNA gyrase inhibitor YacG [Nitrospira sp.]|nr:DNA gyrase inhibitor YacG [Nitrospira sp.]
MRVKCPICDKEVEWKKNLYRPFCSERCKLIDLGKWAAEDYRVPGDQNSGETGQEEDQNGESSENGKESNR